MEDLREDIKHREDVTRTALSLTEYIEKKGDETWADDLVEGLGPWAMLQLADMANFFESVRKCVSQISQDHATRLTYPQFLRMARTKPDVGDSQPTRHRCHRHRLVSSVVAGEDHNLCCRCHVLRPLPYCYKFP